MFYFVNILYDFMALTYRYQLKDSLDVSLRMPKDNLTNLVEYKGLQIDLSFSLPWFWNTMTLLQRRLRFSIFCIIFPGWNQTQTLYARNSSAWNTHPKVSLKWVVQGHGLPVDLWSGAKLFMTIMLIPSSLTVGTDCGSAEKQIGLQFFAGWKRSILPDL